jgi:hypothetical protein
MSKNINKSYCIGLRKKPVLKSSKALTEKGNPPMSIIHIKKMEQRDPKTKTLRTLYAVPSVSITSPQGKKKLIPNPAGMEAARFSTLEAAQQAVSLAGFDWEFEGKVHYGALHNSPSTHPMVQVAKKVFANPMDQARELLKTQLSDKEPSVVANAIYALGAMRAYDAQHESCCSQAIGRGVGQHGWFCCAHAPGGFCSGNG